MTGNETHTVGSMEDVEKLIALHGKQAKAKTAMDEAIETIRELETMNYWECVNHGAKLCCYVDSDYQRLLRRAQQRYTAERLWNDAAVAFAEQGWITPEGQVPHPGIALWASLFKARAM